MTFTLSSLVTFNFTFPRDIDFLPSLMSFTGDLDFWSPFVTLSYDLDLLVGDQPHDCPVWREHLGFNQLLECQENSHQEILKEQQISPLYQTKSPTNIQQFSWSFLFPTVFIYENNFKQLHNYISFTKHIGHVHEKLLGTCGKMMMKLLLLKSHVFAFDSQIKYLYANSYMNFT